jgi:hypothetical protein
LNVHDVSKKNFLAPAQNFGNTINMDSCRILRELRFAQAQTLQRSSSEICLTMSDRTRSRSAKIARARVRKFAQISSSVPQNQPPVGLQTALRAKRASAYSAFIHPKCTKNSAWQSCLRSWLLKPTRSLAQLKKRHTCIDFFMQAGNADFKEMSASKKFAVKKDVHRELDLKNRFYRNLAEFLQRLGEGEL